MAVSYFEVVQQRGRPGPEVMADFGAFTRQAFSPGEGLPVLIPTYNEAEDLPVALAALARSSVDVEPIVVDSSSPDGTAEVASEMGATVLSIDRGQMLAYKAGMQYVRQKRGTGPLLITDADCIPGRKWAEAMVRSANLSPSLGGVAFGTTVFFNGKSPATDAIRSMRALSRDRFRRLYGARPLQRGNNCHVQLDYRDLILGRILEQDDRAFPCDVILGTCIFDVTGQRIAVTNPSTIVLTDGDRYDSVAMLVRQYIGQKTGRLDRIDMYADHGLGVHATAHE